VGVVEEVGKAGRKAFSNYEELWNILKVSSFSPSLAKKETTKRIEKTKKSKSRGVFPQGLPLKPGRR
jgi:hypothetical protein